MRLLWNVTGCEILPIVVIVAIFFCCRWSFCGCSWCDWFEQYRHRHTAIFFGLPSSPCPATHSATHIMSCIVCAGVSRKGGKEHNSFNSIYTYFRASCWVFVFVRFVLRPYIYSALIRLIITFHSYSCLLRLPILIMCFLWIYGFKCVAPFSAFLVFLFLANHSTMGNLTRIFFLKQCIFHKYVNLQ